MSTARTVVVALVACLTVAACGGGEHRTTPATTPPATASSPSAGVAGRVTLDYAEDRSLDLYLPHGTEGPAPLVVLLHGVSDDPEPQRFPGLVAWGERLAARGLAVAVPAYRADLAAGPEAMDDVAAVLRRLDRDAARYGLDPRRRALFGFSAAGPTLVRAAFDPALGPFSAVVGYYTPVEPERAGSLLSLARGRSRMPDVPVLLAYGEQDTVPGVVQSVPRLRRRDPTSSQVTVLVHPTGSHAFDAFQADDPDTRRIVERTADWLVDRLSAGAGTQIE